MQSAVVTEIRDRRVDRRLAEQRLVALRCVDEPVGRAWDAGPRTSRTAEPFDSIMVRGATRIRFRPLGREDRAGLAVLFSRLSETSRYRRFLGPKPKLTERELTYLTDVDHIEHEAIAAVDQSDGSLVGVGRYVRYKDRPRTADMSLEVVDELHNMGIGTALARHVIWRARSNAFAVLAASTLHENRPARAVLRRFGFRAVASDGPTIDFELHLAGAGPDLAAGRASVLRSVA